MMATWENDGKMMITTDHLWDLMRSWGSKLDKNPLEKIWLPDDIQRCKDVAVFVGSLGPWGRWGFQENPPEIDTEVELRAKT